MKRYINWLINWFAQWVGKMSWQDKVAYTLGALSGIVIGLILFVSIDKVPATPMDYQPLEKLAIAVQQNPELLFETNCNIKINEKVITVTFENDNCKVIAKYNKSLKIISSSKEDKSTFGLYAFGVALLTGIFVYSFSTILLMFLMSVLCSLWKWISKNMKSRRH